MSNRLEAIGYRLEVGLKRLEVEPIAAGNFLATASSLQPTACSVPPTSSLQPTARFFPPAFSLQPTACASRRGISLLEVLISMFVLLIGLMGVAALIPAGRFQILQGSKADHASMVGRAAFRDLKVRRYLDPTKWRDSTNASVFPSVTGAFSPTLAMTNGGNAVTPAVAIDPLGLAATTSFTATFPVGGTPALSLTRIFPHLQASTVPLADPVFRSGDDLVFVPNTAGRDLPPIEQMIRDAPVGGNNLKRASEGSYSWLATLVTDPTSSALNSKVIVSVAVFYKRDFSTPANAETIVQVNSFPGLGMGGGEVILSAPAKPIKPRQWLVLAGTLAGNKYIRWYRVTAADAINAGLQSVTLAGPDWNINTSNSSGTANSADVWIVDNVVAVYEKNMRLEIP